MRHYTRINEDFLDTSDIKLDDVSVLDDIREELQRWIDNDDDDELSFDPQRLRDAFFRVSSEQLKTVINKMIDQFGRECSLNWIDVSNVTDMSWLFYSSDFKGDISRWDVSRVTNMAWMFSHSQFNGNISDWDVSSVKDMSGMFMDSHFNGNISGWDVSHVTDMS